MAETRPTEPVRLDGRKLEGGGQLVRIAVALSALTGQSIAIDHIRGNRSGKKGLKASHLAALETLAELSGSRLVKAQVGSCATEFHPPSYVQGEARRTNTEINIRLPTPGSVFLVFQALYPYLLRSETADRIRVSIIGGTNVSSSPSYDYVSQVLIPNFARVGLPPLSVSLEKRGWSSAPGQEQMGKVLFEIDSLWRAGGGPPSAVFPSIDLRRYQRGTISQIDITILAPDDRLIAKPNRDARRHHGYNAETDQPETVREFMERQAHRILRKRLKDLPADLFSAGGSEGVSPETGASGAVPIQTHTTEATRRRSCLYVLIVAHTSTGFRIGRDALYGSLKGEKKPKKRQHKPEEDMSRRLKDLVDECVENFIHELNDPRLQPQKDASGTVRHQPCVDEFMRDQLVVFEALGRSSDAQESRVGEGHEDERYWSLHTQTAQWVCREMLGEDCLG